MELLQRLDDQIIHRNPDRPRQFELPPNWRWSIRQASNLDNRVGADREPKGMRLGGYFDSAPRQTRKKPRRVEHPFEQSFMRCPRSRESRRCSTRPGSGQLETRAARLRPILQKPFHRSENSGRSFEQRGSDRLDGEQRNQPHDGMDFKGRFVAVRQEQTIVVESCSVPKASFCPRIAVDGGRQWKGNARRTSWRCLRRRDCAAPIRAAIRRRFRHTSPSSSCRRPG